VTLRLLERLAEHTAMRPDAPAICYRHSDQEKIHCLNYACLTAAVAQFTKYLQDQLPVGAVLLLCGTNRPQYTISFFSALAAGLRLLAVSPESTEVELKQTLKQIIEQTGAAASIAEQSTLDLVQSQIKLGIDLNQVPMPLKIEGNGDTSLRITARDSEKSQLLLQSSGTTGLPKIVCRSSLSIDAVAANTAKAVGMVHTDRILGVLPLCHSYGMEHGLVAPVFAGACVHLYQGFDLKVASKELQAGGATLLPGVPFMYESLVHLEQPENAADQLGDLRCAYSAGGPLPPSVFQTIKERFGLTIGQLYGATEIGSVSFNPPGDQGFNSASVGYPMDRVIFKILDPNDPDTRHPVATGVEGHVAVNAPSMLSNYLGQEDSPLTDGFFLTGDLGKLDQEGRLFITGRIKLMIDVGGKKVSPIEVEQVLMRHPLISEAAVVPLRLSDTLTRLKAVLVIDESQTLDIEQVRQYCRSQLASHKVPRLFELRKELPKSATGKILRHALEA
jgi:long-chain acyl-CoA synthetase